MKRFLSLVAVFLFVLILACPSVQADTLPFIIDSADLLSQAEEASLESAAEAIQNRYGMDVVVLTLHSLNGIDIETTADDYYDRNGYTDNGVILVLSMQEREWYISTCGDAIFALTDYGISKLGEEMLPYLSAGDYHGAFSAYMDMLPEFFDSFQAGKPIDGYADYSGDYYHGTQEEVVYYEDESGYSLILSMVIGLVVAGVAIMIMRSTMNSKQPQSGAASYVKTGSYKLRTSRDLFLYSNITKTRRQEDNNSSGGGGSSVHRSSSGRSHGGGGGRF